MDRDDRLSLLFEGARYAGERGVQLRPETCNDRDDGNSDACGDQAVFNRCCSGFVFLEPNKKSRHGSLLAISVSPSSRYVTPGCMCVNSLTKNVIKNFSKWGRWPASYCPKLNTSITVVIFV